MTRSTSPCIGSIGPFASQALIMIFASRDECEGSQVDHEEREHICGRPLGLCFDERTGNLYIADAYMGLLVVGPEGGLATKVATQAQGIPFGFTNSLDIDQRTGVVYFSDSSLRFQRRYVRCSLTSFHLLLFFFLLVKKMEVYEWYIVTSLEEYYPVT